MYYDSVMGCFDVLTLRNGITLKYYVIICFDKNSPELRLGTSSSESLKSSDLQASKGIPVFRTFSIE